MEENIEKTGPVVNQHVKSVLLIEDDDMLRKILTIEFKRKGYAILEYSDAASAMSVIEKTKPRIDAAVVDLMNMGYGGNVGDALRSHPEYRATMVIYYSALVKSQFNTKILNHPNTFYIHKVPGSIKTVVEKVDSAI